MKAKNTKPNTIDIQKYIKAKGSLDESGKKKLLQALRLYKEIQEPMWVAEDAMMDKPERQVVAKTFDTKADFDSYVNQRRGIEITPKEMQSIVNFKDAKPTQQDRFFVKFETTDAFGHNATTVIKKLMDGNQLCWTAFSRHETAEEEGKPEGAEEPAMNEEMPTGGDEEVTVEDPIRITKTTTFRDDTEGSNVLADFLQQLDL